jgi:hypothetical protein
MERDTIISFRTSQTLKAKLKGEAARRNTSVSALINENLEAQYSSDEVEPPSEAAWEALRNYVGGADLGGRTPSPEEIDRIVYGTP